MAGIYPLGVFLTELSSVLDGLVLEHHHVAHSGMWRRRNDVMDHPNRSRGEGCNMPGPTEVKLTEVRLSFPPDRAGFEAFFAAQQQDLLRYCWGLTLDREAARDIAQEAMTRLCADWERLAAGNPTGWLRTVALNLVRNRWRSGRRGTVALRRLGDRGAVHHDPEPVDGTVAAALASLPARQREAVVLHHLVDLPVAEVARLLKLSVPTVKTHLQRGRAALAGILQLEIEGDDHA